MKCPNCGKEMVMHLAMSLGFSAQASTFAHLVVSNKDNRPNASALCFPCGHKEEWVEL